MSPHLRLVSAHEPAALTAASHGSSLSGYELDAAYVRFAPTSRRGLHRGTRPV